MASSSEQIQLLIAGYVLGDLNGSEAAEFEQLLASDPAIAEETARMQQALELSYAPLEVAPPPSLRSAILLGAADPAVRSADSAKVQPISTARRSARFPWGRAAGLAAAALIAALGFNNYRLWQTLQETQAQQQQTNALVYSLQGTENANQASATVVVNPDQLEAVLNIENLPPLPPGKVYVLWTVVGEGTNYETDAKGAILTQVFSVNAQGNLLEKITVPEVYRSDDLIAKVAVTLEDVAAPENHVGPIMMITNL